MLDSIFFIHFFTSLLCMVNPFSNVPIFVSITERQPERRVSTALVSFVVFLLVGTLLVFNGSFLINFIEIPLQAFNIFAGLIILIYAIAMVSSFGNSPQSLDIDELEESMESNNVGIVPMVFPLRLGPAAISLIVVFSIKVEKIHETFMLLSSLIAVAIITLLFDLFSKQILKNLNITLIHLFEKLFSIIVGAVAVEILISSIKQVFF